VAAKGAIRTLTKAVAVQYAKDSIRVNSLHPGTISTPRSRDLLSDPEVRSSAISRIPLGRPGTAEDIAQAILYLASDESSFVTGAELIIDGGEMAQ
jgi:3alpha(or 20beta)-hydroxysteroid dehydrogenase